LVENSLANGELIELLPAWQVEPIPLYAVWPGNTQATGNAKVLLEYLG
jgi:DNA-binding transcriptional LysR family regulator